MMKQLKPEPKFNTGHFPLGTVVEFENVFNKVLPEENREWENQLYGISRGTVIGLESNGVDSYIVNIAGLSNDEDPLGNGATNIEWIRRIISRGKDSCAPKDKPERLVYFEDAQQRKWDNSCKHHSKYNVYSIRAIVNYLLLTLDTQGEHLYDSEKLCALVVDDPMVQAGKHQNRYGCDNYTLNKKRLRALVKRLMPKCRLKVKLAAEHERDDWERHYNDIADRERLTME